MTVGRPENLAKSRLAERELRIHMRARIPLLINKKKRVSLSLAIDRVVDYLVLANNGKNQ